MSRNKRILSSLIVATSCALLTVSSTSQAAGTVSDARQSEAVRQGTAYLSVFKEIKEIPEIIIKEEVVQRAKEKEAAEQAAAEQAAREQAAREQAARERAAAEEATRQQQAKEQAQAEQRAAEQTQAQECAVQASGDDTALMAAIIFCEAGNQSYEGQVAVGAVIMNRVRSGQYPDSIREVIYQSGQFGPAVTGWLDKVLASGSYTDTAFMAAQDALAGANPIGNCLYFDQGGSGMQLGDHYFH